VPPEAFTPPPKVTSAVIRVIPKPLDEIPSLSYSTLLIFLDQYSPFKRKTLGASHKIVSKQQAISNKQQVTNKNRNLSLEA
jgi:16S rRNA A1518/A1519 N6-dimethyltransferase RsmA/KsgA/DIM1 with predicted DNA glycosylase/AP lyase activity